MAAVQAKRPLANQVAETVVDSAPVVKIVCALLTIVYLAALIPNAAANLAISPGTLLPQFKIWTALTAGFYETHGIYVLLDFVALFASSATLQPLWRGEEFIRFIVIVQVLTAVSVVSLYFLLYVIVRKEAILFATFNGMGGLVAALAVAMKQVMPDQTITPIPLIGASLRMRHVPLLTVIIAGIMAGIRLLPASSVAGTCLGLLVGWTYLRFFQRQNAGLGNSRGDPSATFSFATFFPDVLQPLVNPIAAILYAVFVALRLCPKQAKIVDIDTFSSTNVHMLSADAQRRKELALKALNSRLKEPDEPEAWPNMEGDGDGDGGGSGNASPYVEIDMSHVGGHALGDSTAPAATTTTTAVAAAAGSSTVTTSAALSA